jgi:hypothetical protein
MKKNSMFSIIVTLISLLVVCASFLYAQKRIRTEKENCNRTFYKTTMMLDILLEEKMTLFKNENVVFDSLAVITDLHNKERKMIDIIAGKPKLCLFISSSFCKDCINYILSEVKNNNQRVIIFASGYTNKDLYVFAKDNAFDVNSIYSIETLNYPIEQLQMPFLFLMYDNGKSSHFFVPRREISDLTIKYFDIISSKIGY